MNRPQLVVFREHVWHLLLLAVPLGMLLAGSLWTEHEQFRRARTRIRRDAEVAAASYGSRIASRLNARFNDLQLAAVALLGPGSNPVPPAPWVVQTLRRFMALHPDLYAFNIQARDGNTILWSTRAQSRRPIDDASAFLPLPGNPDFLLGRDRYAKRVGARVLTMRIRVAGPDGQTRYFVGTPYLLDHLLGDVRKRSRWVLSVLDTRDNHVLGIFRNGQVQYAAKPGNSHGAWIAVPDYPLAVQATWSPTLERQTYLQSAAPRWALEGTALLLIGAAAFGIMTLMRQREAGARHVRRLADFNALLAQANQTMASAVDDLDLLRSICQLAVRYAKLKLAFIAQPDPQGRFAILAASGSTGFTDGIEISIDSGFPHGQGPAGRAWREGRSYYIQSIAQTPFLKPWQDRARRFGLESSASLLIRRQGVIWAIFSVYHDEKEVFDVELKALLEELALDVSHGLDRLDLLRNQALLANALAAVSDGVIINDAQQRTTFVNEAFESITGYTADEMRILDWRVMQGEKTDPETIAERSRLLNAGESFRGEVLNYRKDGRAFWNLLTIDPVRNPAGQITHFVGVLRDITHLRELRARLEFQALHDVLTGIPNRRALEQQLPHAIARARRSGSRLAVGMIDLDDFKPINDTWGHEAGDRLLREFVRRLQSGLRESDMLVRIGGDEFVVIIEEIDELQATNQLIAVLNRLHHAVETAFDMPGGHQARVDMTLGLALFPLDGDDADALLRQADVAMYQAKLHKHDRVHWWRLGTTSAAVPERETNFDVYGEEAAALLVKAGIQLQDVMQRFVNMFYAELAHNPMAQAVLATLSEPEMQTLMVRQGKHLRFLFDPGTTQAMILERARHLGQVHTLTGIGPALLVQSLALYRRLLSEHLNVIHLTARDRYRLLLSTDARLQDDIQSEMQEGDSVMDRYLQLLAAPLPAGGALWGDAAQAELDALGALPGVLACEIMRPDQQGVFQVEASRGHIARELIEFLRTPGFEPTLDAQAPGGHGLVASAWRSATLQHSVCFVNDERTRLWQDRLSAMGVRSMLAVPVLDDRGRVVLVLAIHGAYPNQFNTNWMQQFSRGLQQRWGQVWQRCSVLVTQTVLSQEVAQLYRQNLFAGGLHMYMQPVVDLHTGRLIKLEALARLHCPDALVNRPGEFLPLLGDAELDRLFRMGLDQVLTQLVRWDRQGLSPGITINLPPSTLLDADCPGWVKDALERFGVAPDRVTFELLESQGMDNPLQVEALDRLLKLGVNLAMDDLGSGHSSLRRLASLPFETIKIDKSLLSRIGQEPIHTLSLVRAIIQVGLDLERVVVVEGLADDGMIEVARILGAPLGQGYGLAMPMPAEQVLAWSQSFRLPTHPNRIETYLGALAHHWLGMRRIAMGVQPGPRKLPDCPVTKFLEEQNLADGKAAAWHAQVHAGVDVPLASSQFLKWLIERVREEHPGSG
ncbi:MAG: diguanylate cyclase domain-containing protein [Acidiferrobacterales bacterium]